MRPLARAAGLLGLGAAVWLVWTDHPKALLRLLEVGGFGLVFAACFHLVPMLANAYCWRTLILGGTRPSAAAMLQIVWIRESVNGLLPVARVGGEVVSLRLLRNDGVPAAGAAGSMIVDLQLAIIAQFLFTGVGIAVLLTKSNGQAWRLASTVGWGIAACAPLALGFAAFHHTRLFERSSRLLQKLTGGRLSGMIGPSAQLDTILKEIWSQRGVILRFLFVWQPLQMLGVSCEFWLALYFMQVRVGLADAVALESLIQALASLAFFIPGAVGVQEGGLVVIGGALGLDPPVCLALAGARRLRDLLIFLPGLVAWQFAEKSPALLPPGNLPGRTSE